jgi:hypothetical protein
MILRRSKEWWLRLAESEGDLPIGAGSLIHSSNGCCNPSCEVCSGAPCHSTLCEICHPESNYFARPPNPITIARITQTGFDKWLEDQLKDPVFREEYEKAKKEIEEYDRQHREKESLEKAGKPSG